MSRIALLLLIGALAGLSCCFGAKPNIERIARPLTILLLVGTVAMYVLGSVTHA